MVGGRGASYKMTRITSLEINKLNIFIDVFTNNWQSRLHTALKLMQGVILMPDCK